MHKVIYYSDELNDDFAGTTVNTKPVEKDFKFIRRNILWRIGSWMIYYFLALPIVWLIVTIGYGHRFKNRKVLKKARKTGYFIYGNHTSTVLDAFKSCLVSFPKRNYIISNPDAISIKGIKNLVLMLGCIPVPGSYETSKNFLDAIQQRVQKEKQVITIYPEAHIWPYYNKIRPFTSVSFGYPIQLDVPVFALTVVYKKRRFIKKPKPITYVSGPFYPDRSLNPREAQIKLRNEVYDSMDQCVKKNNSYEYIKYIKR